MIQSHLLEASKCVTVAHFLSINLRAVVEKAKKDVVESNISSNPSNVTGYVDQYFIYFTVTAYN